VTNIGSEKGIVEIEIRVDESVLRSQELALLPGKCKPARFNVLVPQPGVYVVRVGNLAESFQVLETD
jgi:hypothetical protein